MKIASFLLSGFLLSAHALAGLTGQVRIDGSSTVFPISEAVAEEFQKANAGVKVTVAQSGTGGGFKKFVANEIDISDASRTIKKEEAEAAEKAKILWTDVPVAYDGITVVINPKNTWVKSLTIEQLKKIWEPESKVKTWKDVDASWPDSKIKLYGPGADSGTFDYFTEHVNGKAKAIRPDFTASEDDNVLVKGVAGDKDALGYFGIAYYEANSKKVKSVAVAGTDGKFVSPTVETVKDGTYPISRPLFIYVNHASLAKPEVSSFVNYYLTNAKKLVAETGYVPMTEAQYKAGLAKIAAVKK
jgi:phosphate transport system substrate-binding protein